MEENNLLKIDKLNTVDLKRIFSLLRRNLWLLMLGLFLSGGAAYAASQYQTPIYEAKTQVMVTRASSSGPVSDVTQTLNTQQLGLTYVELLSQDWVREDVASRIGGEVGKGQLDISAAANTLVINIVSEDPDPNRAALIADTLVQVLVTQNDSIQSGRYTDAEQGLNLQIQQIQGQIAEVQLQLDLARTGALDEKIAQMLEKIESTQANLEMTNAEIANLEALTTARAAVLLLNDQNRFERDQALLETQLAEYQELNDKFTNDPLVEQDPEFAVLLQGQLAEKGVEINTTREGLAALESDIAWLTPLAEEGELEKALAEKMDNLALQETLLASYQESYTGLLISGEVQVDTEDVAKLVKDLNLFQQIYLNLVNSRETVRLEKMQNMPNVIQVNPAVPGEKPVRPRVLLNTVLGAIAGLILAVVVVLLTDFLDTTLKTREDVESQLKLPVMGRLLQLENNELTKDGPYVVHVPRSPASEAFRSLRTNLEFIGVDHPLKSILISSPGASEGKTTVAANLAAVIAQSGKRIVLLDADLRRPRVHREMGLVNRIGLSDVFRDKATLQDVIQPWGELDLSVITSGGIPPNPTELLGSDKMGRILSQLEADYDVVIIDSTPTIVTDSQLIAARADGVLLVLWPGRTQAEAAKATVEQYRRVGARLLGAVLNNIQGGNGYGGYDDYQYYQYNPEPGNGGLKMPWNRKAAKKDTEEENI